MRGLPQKQNARRAYKIRLCGHLRRYKKIVKKTYIILENYYQNIYGMYDDNWIDYDLDVAFTKLQLEKIIQKRYKLDHQEKMILQWLLEEDMEPKVCEAIRVILEMDV